jgi:hypothetical protein
VIYSSSLMLSGLRHPKTKNMIPNARNMLDTTMDRLNELCNYVAWRVLNSRDSTDARLYGSIRTRS